MASDPSVDSADTPKLDPSKLANDPDALKHAHGRTGSYLKQAGLPFEDEEFDDSAPRASDEPAAEPTADAADK